MIELVNKKKNVNLTGTSGKVDLTQGGGGSGGFYKPVIDNKGNLEWMPSKPTMPKAEGFNIYHGVKIWSAADGLEKVIDPLEFDYSILPYGEDLEFSALPEKLDFSQFEGREVGAMFGMQTEDGFRIFITFGQSEGNTAFIMNISKDENEIDIAYLRGGEKYLDFPIEEEGWYEVYSDGAILLPQGEIEVFKNLKGDNLKIVDFGTLTKMGEDMEIVSEEFIEFFLRDFLNFYFPSGGIYRLPSKDNMGGYYTPELDDKGNIHWIASNNKMPKVEDIDIWNRLKIWNIDDGLKFTSDNPYDFDLTQIEKGEDVDLWLELSNFDVSKYEGRNCGACLLMVDEAMNFCMLLNFANIAGMPFICGIQLKNMQGEGAGSVHYLKAGSSYINFTAETEGWYFGNFDKPEEVIKIEGKDTSIYGENFKDLKIIDVGSFQLAQASEMLGVKVENVIEDFINSVFCFCLPRKYNYKIPKVPNTKGIVINQTISEGGEIGEGSIATEHLADNAVISNKIADGSITTGKLALNAVGGSHIASKMISSRHLAFDAVQTFAIKDGAVTPAKLDREYATKEDLENIEIDVDLSGYATKEDLENIEVDVDLTGYITQEDLEETVANLPTYMEDVEITPEDEGKFLIARGGKWVAEAIPRVSEEEF